MNSLRRWLVNPTTTRDVSLLTFLVGVLYFLTGDHPALGSANRYTESCREMVELNQWAVPHLGYVPYCEKPILTYWLGAAAQWLFGSGNLASNLPAGLAAVVSVLATYALGTRLRGPVFGLCAGFLLLTCGLFLGMATTLTTDPILAACLAVGWWTWWSWEVQRQVVPEAGVSPVPNRWIWGFWVALGAAFLAKGPVAIVVAGLAIGGYAMLAGGLRGVITTLWAMCPMRGLGIIAAINLPWSFVVWQRDPRFLEFFYVRINYQAFFDGSINHPGPWWYYGPMLAGYLAPYSLIALPALIFGCWQAVAPAGKRSAAAGAWWGGVLPASSAAAPAAFSAPPLAAPLRPRLYLASVVLFPLVFFSLSASKLGTYPLPLLPVMVVLVADVWWTWHVVIRRWWIGVVVVKIMILQGVVAAAPWLVVALQKAAVQQAPATLSCAGFTWAFSGKTTRDLQGIDWSYLPLAQVAIMVMIGGLLWSCVSAVRGRMIFSMGIYGASLAMVVVLLLPRVDRFVIDLDGSRLMTVVLEKGSIHDQVIVTQDVVHDYELTHTLGRRLAILGDARELGMGHLAESTPSTVPFPKNPYKTTGENLPQNPWLYSRSRLTAEWVDGRRLWLVCERGDADKLEKSGLTVYQIAHDRDTLLISNQPNQPNQPNQQKQP